MQPQELKVLPSVTHLDDLPGLILLLPYTGEGNELFMTRYVFVEIEAAPWVLTDLGE
ncbi:TraV family lipoprotein [Desulfobulbus alkaliphilus]|uniref:TraV family lipoprotein n=1 Tax=Desulfobulbus alkaliphilus TaxID=869814 RepID=UPI0019653BD9|nr:TraV family lipoprotein [Desulfobulbus alkaliphilus]MBM9538500.1 hypothetical protein [Desulfobulbus alkaliphilus]